MHTTTLISTTELPFTVGLATSEADIVEVAKHRALAYSKEMPELARKLWEPEPADARAPGREIIIARSRFDGGVIGSLRLHLNHQQPLPLQGCVQLPAELEGKLLLEGARLAVSGGLVYRTSIFKAFIEFARLHGVDHCAVAARPRISVIHESLGFVDLFPSGKVFPISYANDVEHRIMGLSVRPEHLIDAKTAGMKQSLFDFIIRTRHTEINVGDALALP